MTTIHFTLLLIAALMAGIAFYKFIQLMNSGIKLLRAMAQAKQDDSKAYREHLAQKTDFQRRHIQALELTIAEQLAGN